MNKLKRARVLADMSQRQLAEATGLSKYRVQVIERGWGVMRADELKVFAKVLGVKRSELSSVL